MDVTKQSNLYLAKDGSSGDKIEWFIESYRGSLEGNISPVPEAQQAKKTTLPDLGELLSQVGNVEYYVEGTKGDDRIYSYKGSNNVIDGKDGNDTLYGEEKSDIILGGKGDDRVASAEGDDVVFAGDENDTVLGQGGDDKIYGQKGDDILTGNDGNDKVDGGSGNDILYMASGNDELHGAEDNDVFALTSLATRRELCNQDSPLTGVTTLKDFKRGEDKIRIESTLAASLETATFERKENSTIIHFQDQEGEFLNFSIIVENVPDININDFYITPLDPV